MFILNIRGLIFEVCQKTAKTAKCNSLENFRLYGSLRSLIYTCIQAACLLCYSALIQSPIITHGKSVEAVLMVSQCMADLFRAETYTI